MANLLDQVVIKRAETKADWDTFIGLPWKIYKNDPYWVPPLRIAVRDLLDVAKNPFFRHAERVGFLAYQGGECVGRIAAIIDQKHIEFHAEKCGFFGFFECINDQLVANLLLDEATRWVRAKGMNIIRGPMNPSTNHECGLLVEGFDDPPQIMMTYNPPYYIQLIEGWGAAKAKDLLAYKIDKKVARFSERLIAHAERIKNKGHIVLRSAKMPEFDREIDKVLEVYNDAWESNWGFVPMSPDEFRHAAKDMKMILDPRLLLLAEVRGKIAGFGLALPDINQVLIKIPDGKLFPFGLAKLLWHLKGPFRSRTINRCRILTLGIKKEFRELGLGAVMYTEYFKVGPAAGYPVGEASWILEDNKAMNSAAKLMAGDCYKRYRIYERAF